MHVFVFVFVCRGVQLISSTLNKLGLFSDCKSPTHSLFSPPLCTLSPALEARGDHNNNNSLLSLALFLLPLFSLSSIHTHKHIIVPPPPLNQCRPWSSFSQQSLFQIHLLVQQHLIPGKDSLKNTVPVRS